MSHDGYHTVLVLGGIRSGKSEFAEARLAGAPAVRYVATAAADPADQEWSGRLAAHQSRRPASWTTEEAGVDPERLIELISEAQPGDTLLVDDLGGWVTAVLGKAAGPLDSGWTAEAIREPLAGLTAAVAASPARLVLVSPEVGLSVVPATVSGRAFADAMGVVNRALAAQVDGVALIIAGQPSWIKGAAVTPAAAAETPAEAPVETVVPIGANVVTAGERAVPPPAPLEWTPVVPATAAGAPSSETTSLGSGTELPASPGEPEINSRMMLPLPDETATAAALSRLRAIDVPGAGLGRLARLVGFAAGVQGSGAPGPFRAPRLILVQGAHEGGLAAGDSDEAVQREVDRAVAGESPLGVLARTTGVPIQVVDVTAEPAAPVEDGDATDAERVEIGLRQGFRLAEAAVDAGTDLIILGAVGTGQVGAAAAVVAATITIDPAAALPRVVRAGGHIDDEAWMARCVALRDGLRRAKGRFASSVEVLTTVGGYDLAVATGILLGATYRRTAVLIDGPVGVAAGMLARDLGSQSRLWLLVADDGQHPVVTPAAKVLGAGAIVDVGLDLGEGAGALTVFPLLQHALLLATLPRYDASTAAAGVVDEKTVEVETLAAESSSAW
jgi:nicotinate-nucleotide--dimethylbenzimidazole phosphoribosyltransferase